MVARRLSTIGYEGKTLDEFLDALANAGVERVIDVRAVAASRRPGFSKIALSGALAERGIDYLQLRALGTPKAGREAARSGNAELMRAIYAEHLETPEAELGLEQANAAAAERHSALLCYEADASGCHRALVAERLAQRSDFSITDL